MRPRRRQLRGFLCVVALCSTAPAGAQQAAQDTGAAPSPTPIADAAERIARELFPEGLADQVQSDGSTFRLNIHAPGPGQPFPRIDDPQGPTRPPAGGSLYHQQMLESVVPQEFRASTFNTPRVSIDPATIVNGIRGVWRDVQVRRVRAQIARELAELEAANAAAER